MSDIARYLVARILQALAEDARTNILDLQVKVTAGRVFLIGEVDSPARRRAAEDVTREVVPVEMSVVNELCLAKYNTPAEPETVP